MNRRLKISIYSDYPSSSLSTPSVVRHLKGLGLDARDRGSLMGFLSLSEEQLFETAEKLAGAVVADTSTDLDSIGAPDSSQVSSEVDRLMGGESARGILYDGFWLERIFHRALARRVPEELGEDYLHLLFTGRLFGTFEDRRYHARVVLMGEPSLISTSGLVEAPAKPREYYYIKGGLIQSGRDLSVLDEMYRGRYVEYDDPKCGSIMCSYALQPVFYRLTGKAFCDNPMCCLFNSHMQEDVLRTQYNGSLCEDCTETLNG